ncbi:MAG TPA: site-2 protease family protein [Noviherbaspirillum sp.]|nr:site-2 protease family protein [Noviherbaspirillum sp.]
MKSLLLLFKFAKLGKLLTTGGSMLLSVIAYSFVYGWRYAAGFVALLFVHELGHYAAARQKGLDVGAPAFIPFVGAWIAMKEMPKDVETEAYVGMAGPFVGTLAALACYYLARATGSSLLLALSYAGFFLNLFNLIPLSPLDGGRITAILSPRIWFAGVPVLLLLFFWHPSPMLILIGVLALPQLAAAWKYDPADPEHAAYYNVSQESRVTYAITYIGLVVFLSLMTYELHNMLGSGLRF